jgi:hypothetical protein
VRWSNLRLYTGPEVPELSVKKGNFVFQVRIYGFPVKEIKTKMEEIKSEEKTLALDVLAKL